MEMIVPGTSWKANLALVTLSAAFLTSTYGVARSDDKTPQQVQLNYSQWTKICVDGRSSDLGGCLIGKEGRIDGSARIISAVVVDQPSKPLIRINFPLGMQVGRGTRLIVDNGRPQEAPYINCLATGCIAEYELTSDLRDSIRRGKNLTVQAFNINGAPLTLTLPLAGFENSSSGRPQEQSEIDRDQQAMEGKKPPAVYLADPRVALLPARNSRSSPDLSSLIYQGWTKFCLKGPEASAKQTCFTGNDARLEPSESVAAAVLIETEGQAKKILRVTLPLGVELVHGTRVIVDNNAPLQSTFAVCFKNGCMSDYEGTAELLASLKKGQNLVIQGISSNGAAISTPLPLAEFAKAYNGPPVDPKAFEEAQKKLQEDMKRRAAAKASDQPSLAAAAATPPPAPPQASTTMPGRVSPAGRRVALVIGNSAYKAMPVLRNPTNDATDVANALKNIGFETVVATDLTRAEMDQAVDRFSRIANGADVALVYYSGHGMQFGGKNYLLPIDADLQNLADINRYRLLPVDDLVDVLQSAKGPQLIVLDACRNNPVERDFKNKFAAASGSLTRDGGVSRGFERIDARNGLVVVYSTASNSVAADGSDRNSPFTKVFLKDMVTPDIEFRQMLFRVQSDVYEATKQQQLPEISSLYIGPDVRLVVSSGSQTR